jgi:hypothetical protein
MGDDRDLFDAGVELLRQSRLIEWDGVSGFRGRDLTSVEDELKLVRFGRVRSWILFVVGAEYLLKTVCYKYDIRGPEPKAERIAYPASGDVETWAHEVSSGGTGGDEISFEAYGDLGKYVECVPELAEKLSLSPEEKELLTAGFMLLRVLRNRDVHSYVRDVRKGNFYLVKELFMPCLNTLLKSMPVEWMTGL